ncbi:MAG: hypothetical protein AAF529_04260 [Pseudomonadota bacterium]
MDTDHDQELARQARAHWQSGEPEVTPFDDIWVRAENTRSSNPRMVWLASAAVMMLSVGLVVGSMQQATDAPDAATERLVQKLLTDVKWEAPSDQLLSSKMTHLRVHWGVPQLGASKIISSDPQT